MADQAAVDPLLMKADAVALDRKHTLLGGLKPRQLGLALRCGDGGRGGRAEQQATEEKAKSHGQSSPGSRLKNSA